MTIFELYGYLAGKEYSKLSTTNVYRLFLAPLGPPPTLSNFKPIVMFF